MNARDWLAAGTGSSLDVAVLGAPISRASISPSEAWATPPAFRDALRRYHTWDGSSGSDLMALRVGDLGDVAGDQADADAGAAHARIRDAVARAAERASLVVVIGGDNSLTRPAMQGMMDHDSGREWGLLTFDAHHDCRPADEGPRNGTPVRELIEGGVPGPRVAQVGINPFGNEREHARWAAAQGVHAYPLDEVRRLGVETAVTLALDAMERAGANALYVDVDLDVVERACAPACPASLPGGLSPHELLRGVGRALSDPRVRAVDLTEVDARADVAEVTVRLMAAVFVTACSTFALRASSTGVP